MSDLSKALGSSAPPHRITHEGRDYPFHPLDQKRKSALEKRLYQNAREAVYVDREHMDPEMYASRLDKVREAYESGDYGFFGKRCSEILKSATGVMMLLEVITGETQDDLLPLLTERPEEVNAVLKTVLEESFRRKGVGHV